MVMKRFEFEVAYGVKQYADDKNLDKSDGTNAIQEIMEKDFDLVKKLAKDEIRDIVGEHGPIHFNYGIVNTEFQEFDSNRWHGSGYWLITIEAKDNLIDEFEASYDRFWD